MAALGGGGAPAPAAAAGAAKTGAGALGAPTPAQAKTPEKTAAPAKAEAPKSEPAKSKGQQIVDKAMQHKGKPYKFGAAGPGSFDCSGLTLSVMKEFGVSLPHSAGQQMRGAGGGQNVAKKDLQPGDLVFFDGGGHTGIYIGNNQFIHAPKPGDVVKVAQLDGGYWGSRFENGRRFP